MYWLFMLRPEGIQWYFVSYGGIKLKRNHLFVFKIIMALLQYILINQKTVLKNMN
jgi:hypothetical protein